MFKPSADSTSLLVEIEKKYIWDFLWVTS